MKLDELKAEIVRASGVRRDIQTAPGFASFYTNDTQVMTSPWDLRLSFGVIDDVDQEKKEAIVQRVAEVRMSPQHAKRLVAVLTEQLQSYEKAFGTIPQPVADDGKS